MTDKEIQAVRDAYAHFHLAWKGNYGFEDGDKFMTVVDEKLSPSPKHPLKGAIIVVRGRNIRNESLFFSMGNYGLTISEDNDIDEVWDDIDHYRVIPTARDALLILHKRHAEEQHRNGGRTRDWGIGVEDAIDAIRNLIDNAEEG